MASLLILLCCTLGSSAMAQPPPSVQNLIIAVENLVKDEDRNLGELKLALARLVDELPALENAAQAGGATDADREWYSRAKAAAAEARKILDPDLADLIGTTKPMTAVLFSEQERNSFEVVNDPQSAVATTGIINQSQEGSTGGILVAAEAPFAFPKWKGKNRYFPIGAWFGVNLKTGGGEDVGDVDLAAGFSFSFISANRLQKLRQGQRLGLSGSARLLLGVVYGEVTTLGPKDANTALQVGDPYPLGDSLPLNKDKELSFAYGIGFRF